MGQVNVLRREEHDDFEELEDVLVSEVQGVRSREVGGKT